jgi:hypothetical protein
MWAGDVHWLPYVLTENHVAATIDFNADGETITNMTIDLSDG